MEKHITILGVLYIAFSCLGLLAAIIVFTAVTGAGILSGGPGSHGDHINHWICGRSVPARSLRTRNHWRLWIIKKVFLGQGFGSYSWRFKFAQHSVRNHSGCLHFLGAFE